MPRPEPRRTLKKTKSKKRLTPEEIEREGRILRLYQENITPEELNRRMNALEGGEEKLSEAEREKMRRRHL